jgi:hypothetical protein
MAKPKNMNINIDPALVVYTSIMKDKSGFNSARIVMKTADKEYLQISYDWEGGTVPDFALNLMDFMKSNSVETSGVWPNQEVAYEEFSASKKAAPQGKEKMCPDCKNPMSMCTCKDGKPGKKMTPEEMKQMMDQKKKK